MKIIFGVVLLLSLHIHSQKTGQENLGAWYMYAGSHRISNKICINSGVQLWDYEPTRNFNMLLIQTGLSYDINADLIATMGYCNANIDRTFDDISEEHTIKEHRLFEQIRLKNSVWKFHLEHRYRLEHRFMNDGNSSDLTHRNRYRLQLTVPLTETFFINFYDEIFLNFENDLFNQNRLYGALGVCITPNSKIQLGYLKHHFSSVAYDRLQVGISIRTDSRKKKEFLYAVTDSVMNDNQSLSE